MKPLAPTPSTERLWSRGFTYAVTIFLQDAQCLSYRAFGKLRRLPRITGRNWNRRDMIRMWAMQGFSYHEAIRPDQRLDFLKVEGVALIRGSRLGFPILASYNSPAILGSWPKFTSFNPASQDQRHFSLRHIVNLVAPTETISPIRPMGFQPNKSVFFESWGGGDFKVKQLDSYHSRLTQISRDELGALGINQTNKRSRGSLYTFLAQQAEDQIRLAEHILFLGKGRKNREVPREVSRTMEVSSRISNLWSPPSLLCYFSFYAPRSFPFFLFLSLPPE
ncbi:hypothetical protein VNO77_37625 [Canavalia gladiata]|uniref:Uncharacterized protein n=1 Tax=Canavalia gladiata TaxID=3824 RepID=A0AAN9PYK3_CANGL